MTIKYKAGSGILLFLYSRKRDFYLFRITTPKTMNRNQMLPVGYTVKKDHKEINSVSKTPSHLVRIFRKQSAVKG
jgi:hypothetical protein